MKLKISGKSLLTHIFFIFFFLVLPALVFQRLPGESVFTVTRVIIQDSIANFTLLCFFYLNYYVLIPKYYFEKKYIQHILFVILFLIIAFQLPHFVGRILPDTIPDPVPGFQGQERGPAPGGRPPGGPHGNAPLFSFTFDEFIRHFYLFFTAVFFSFLLRTRERLSQLKEDKLKAELSTLKAQINPHFLFNTLNSIYSLSVKKDDKASDAIIHLSGLMRYVIKEANDHTIPLQKEIDYIANYIELQKARLGNTAAVLFDVYGVTGNKRITPLILITYIENAFKYGVNPDVEGCIVKVKLQITETGIMLYTFNKKMPHFHNIESTGIGMKNTSERLKHLYPAKHHLEIAEDPETYSVQLLIELT
ncbi:MAG: sensor histidine kinase [Niabella sp.]